MEEKMSKEELIGRIKELEFELKTSKKYGLVWDKENTKEDVVLKCENEIPVLTQDKSKKILLNTGENNILIEGDNYHALTALNFIAKESIDIIYIDPPYNTGNKSKDGGFKYNDIFIDKENAYRHSTWLSYIQKRLLLSKKLMTEKGVIFISIDDNEVFNLKILCDAIFGEKNFLGNIIQNKGNAQNDAKNIQKNHDYILVYCKKREYKVGSDGKLKETSLISLPAIDEKEVFMDEEGRYYYEGSGLLTGSSPTLRERPNLGYTIYFNPNTKHIIGIHDYDVEKVYYSDDENVVYQDRMDLLNNGYVKIRPPKKGRFLGRWTWGIEKFNSESYKILITKNFSVKTKVFVEEKSVIKKGKKMFYQKTYRTNNLKSIYDFSSSKGTDTLQKILPDCDFNNPKNLDMIKMFIESINNKNARVLDFFAGSGTTGQAVMELNKEDGGHRRFILCTNNENNICTDVTYPRLKTVITGIRADGSKYSDGLPNNLYYFKSDFVKDENNTEQARYCLVEKVDGLLCIAENVFDEVERNNYSSHYVSKDKHLFIYSDYYSKEKFNEFKNRVMNAKGDKVVYVYSSDNNVDETLFEDKTIQLKTIPMKIYEIYKGIVEEIKRGE